LGITETPPAYFRPGPIETQWTLEHHFEPPPGTFDEDLRLAWWTYKKLQDIVHEDYQNRLHVMRPAWQTLERRLFRDQQKVETEALTLWQTDEHAARGFLTGYCAQVAAKADRQARRLIQRLQARGGTDDDSG
jgi:dipeptidase